MSSPHSRIITVLMNEVFDLPRGFSVALILHEDLLICCPLYIFGIDRSAQLNAAADPMKCKEPARLIELGSHPL